MRQTSPSAAEAHGKRTDALSAGAHQRLRDVDRWKDKIEIRLDNRQVAFLFFGSALIACLLFILGVIVGKRLESRGHALAPEIEDPLALLDRVASSVPAAPVARSLGQVAISRAHAATATTARAVAAPAEKPARADVKPEVVLAKVAPAAVEAKVQAKAEIKPEPKPEPNTEPKPLEAKAAVAAKIPAAKAVEPEVEALPAVAAAAVKAKPVALATTTAVATPAPVRGAANPELLPPSSAAPAASAVAPAQSGSRFMLQVGSFQDRAEAEAFAGSFSGERPQIITSELPGKGTWYRVRVGGWTAFQEAVAAKLAFEKRYSKIALVVGPL